MLYLNDVILKQTALEMPVCKPSLSANLVCKQVAGYSKICITLNNKWKPAGCFFVPVVRLKCCTSPISSYVQPICFIYDSFKIRAIIVQAQGLPNKSNQQTNTRLLLTRGVALVSEANTIQIEGNICLPILVWNLGIISRKGQPSAFIPLVQ